MQPTQLAFFNLNILHKISLLHYLLLGWEWIWNSCKYLFHLSSEHHQLLTRLNWMMKQIYMFTKLVSLHRHLWLGRLVWNTNCLHAQPSFFSKPAAGKLTVRGRENPLLIFMLHKFYNLIPPLQVWVFVATTIFCHRLSHLNRHHQSDYLKWCREREKERVRVRERERKTERKKERKRKWSKIWHNSIIYK